MFTTENVSSLHHNDAHEEHSKTRPSSTLTENHPLPPSTASSTHDLNDHVLTVDWDGPDDPENPRKYALHHLPFRIRLNWLLVRSWSFSKKWQATLAVSAFTFISPVSSSMIAPASSQLAERFDIHSTVILAMTTSVFVLGYGGYVSFSAQTAFAHCGFCYCHSLWAFIPWPSQRDVRTLACITTCQPVVPGYMLSLIHRQQLTVPLISLEYSLWFCEQQEYAYSVSLPSRTRWFSPSVYWWRCNRRPLRCRTSRTGNCYLLTRTSPWSCSWSCCWGLDRGKINLALGGMSRVLQYSFPGVDINSSGRRLL